MTSPDERLLRLARQHDGLLTRTLAAAQHLTPAVLRAAVTGGTMHRIRPGVFVTDEVWAGAQPHERYVLTVRGLLLAHPGWMASHHAALALAGLPLHAVDLGMVDVAASLRASKVRPGVHVHVATPEQVRDSAGQDPRTVGVVAACVLTAAASGFHAGVVAMDAALHRRMLTKADLRTALTLPGARYGVGQARAAIDAADPACESPGESLTRVLLVAAGMTVRSQVSLSDDDGFIGRVDFLVGDRVVVEFDGAVKYDGLDGKRALMAEKRREERLRDAGFRVVRVTWGDLSHPERILARVRGHVAA